MKSKRRIESIKDGEVIYAADSFGERLARWYKVAEDFEPHHIFYETNLDKYHPYDKPVRIGFGFTTEGYWSHKTKYTRLGQWFRDKPFILYFVVGLLYYPWAWPLWWVLQIFVFGIPKVLFMKWDA